MLWGGEGRRPLAALHGSLGMLTTGDLWALEGVELDGNPGPCCLPPPGKLIIPPPPSLVGFLGAPGLTSKSGKILSLV